MTITQWIKLIIKIITLLPVIMEGIKSIMEKYKALNIEDF